MTVPPAPAAVRFLLVDDSKALLAILRRAIEDAGYDRFEIVTACDGEEALELSERLQPHLIVTDWHMPRMSGIEMLQMLRQKGARHIKVGFVTSEADPQRLEQARTNGAVFVLPKPFADHTLVRALHEAVPPNAAHAEPQTLDDGGASPPLQASACERLLKAELRVEDLRVEDGPQLEAGTMSGRMLLGLYGSPTPRFVVLMDLASVCVVGGLAAGIPRAGIIQAFRGGIPDVAMIEKCTHVLRALGGQLAPSTPLAHATMVPSTMERLRRLTDRTSSRTDVVIRCSGFGSGRLSVIRT